jgi:hypothetical protein
MLMEFLVLKGGDWHRFESDLSIEQHRFFNKVLNRRVSENVRL